MVPSRRTVPLLDLVAQHASLRTEIESAVRRVLESGRYILGPEVEALEQELATDLGAGVVGIGVSSGSDALLVALMALAIGPGDEVVVPAFSFFATAGSVARLGATPVFADVDEATGNLDPGSALARLGSRTKALLPVHLFGRCAPLEPYRSTLLPVVEDAAQALGSRDRQGRAAGALGRIGCVSFFPSKNLGTAGDGGMLFTTDAALADRVRLLRAHGARPKYRNLEVGGNFRLDALHAAILRAKRPHLARFTEARRRHAAAYREQLAETPLALPADEPGHVYNQFTVRVPGGAAQREALRRHLHDAGITTEVYYPSPLHLQPCFADLGYRPGSLPVAERLCDEALSLPIYPELTPDDLAYVADAVRGYYG